MNETLVLFTRYPEPGKTKTRLIPHLGAEGAADLQEELTGHTVLTARHWAATRQGRFVIRTTGAPVSAFEHWLGPGTPFLAQGDGDLGQRMQRAVEESLTQHPGKVILIGADCPDVRPDLLDAACDALDKVDVVIGPATDGGYYLIGMKQCHPALFDGIAWGSHRVLTRTREIIADRKWRATELESLTDVDELDDLSAWERIATPGTPGGISVIVPALNEQDAIAACVESAIKESVEVIVADAGSDDATREHAQAVGARVIQSPRGRAAQMNAGARHAQGEYLLFLHADTRLPAGYADVVRGMVSDPAVTAGAFSLAINAPGARYRVLEWGVRARCRLFSLPYGDQALCVKRATFRRIGGFAPLPLMEDLDLVRRLRRRGEVRTSVGSVITSARRWEKIGAARSVLLNQLILAGSACGASPQRLARWYQSTR